MNEDTLKALTQLLALVTLQDHVVTETERNYVINLFRQDLDPASLNHYIKLFDKLSGYEKQTEKIHEARDDVPISMKDTVRTLAICNKINKTLEIRQKLFLLLKILQLIAVDGNFSVHKQRIIETISAVFNIKYRELKIIEDFVFYRPGNEISYREILIVNNQDSFPKEKIHKHIQADLSGELIFLKLQSIDMYFVKYYGDEEIILNGFIMDPIQIYMFTNGSSLKTQLGRAIYYSDLIKNYLKGFDNAKISLNAENVTFKFLTHETGLQNIIISEDEAKLIGILGASGSGKTTLLNVLAGIYKPSDGTVKVNNIDIHSTEHKRKLKGMIGYIAQDDMLIEELTVYQNLYYNAKLCFGDLSDDLVRNKVKDILTNLGLWERKDMRVGNIPSEKISGGQRKRLNIALELIREPYILFIDEPTSGLSSRDSENVMDLLKELTYRGKLVFVVIHQPSSDIYKLFDKIIILDIGGYPIYYGNPIEAITHFKRATRQLDSEKGICPACGNINPELIFNIVEEKVVDEFGNFTDKRKVKPSQWTDLFQKSEKIKKVKDCESVPDQKLVIPSRFRQIGIFIQRDLLSKLSDRQYLIINLLEAPVLAFILAGIVRYQNAFGNTAYLFRFNENIPVYIMMSIIVAIFLGLMVSAEELIRDRKILQREAFLNLSRNSYLLSKLSILFLISAIQTFSFVIVGNLILEIKGMILAYWLILFTVSCFGNLLGLNISDSFRSSVTVYILIPLLIIPQMVLSGLLVSYDKINEILGNKAEVPLVADLMTSRWAFEAMAVYQFINNSYEKSFYQIDQEIAQAEFKSTFYVEKLKELLDEVVFLKDDQNRQNISQDNAKLVNQKNETIQNNLGILKNELMQESFLIDIPEIKMDNLSPDKFELYMVNEFYNHILIIKSIYRKKANNAIEKKDKLIYLFEHHPVYQKPLDQLKNEHYNERLADMVRNYGSKEKIIIYGNRLKQLDDPVYQSNIIPGSIFDYRTYFFAPRKQLFGIYFNTFTFNTLAVWLLTTFLYITLYFQVLKKIMYVVKYRRSKYFSSFGTFVF